MREELEKELRRIAPQFLAEMDLNEMQSCMARGIECYDGWFEPLKRFCENVEALNKESPDKVIVAKQIKTKFGDIRVYWGIEDKNKPLLEREPVQDDSLEHIMNEEVINLENECRNTCEICGSKGVKKEYYTYICKKCKEKERRNGKTEVST